MGCKRRNLTVIFLLAFVTVCFGAKRFDSAYVSGGLKSERLYFGILKGASASSLTADTISAGKILKMDNNSVTPTTDGSLWYDESHGTIHSQVDGVTGFLSRVLFVQSNIKLDSNSTDEVSLRGDDSIHTLDSFPAGYFLKGKSYRFYISGRYSTKSTSAGNLIVRIKMNSTVLCSAIVVLDNNEIDEPWQMCGVNTCIDTGTTGSFRLSTGFEHTIEGAMHNDRLYTEGTTVNTKIKLMPDITVQFSVADVANKIRSFQFVIEELH